MITLLSIYRDKRDRRTFAQAQNANIAAQLMAVDAQIDQILNAGLSNMAELSHSSYVLQYVIGMLESITRIYERETRLRLGVSLYRDLLVYYLCDQFSLPHEEAEKLFDEAAALHEQNPLTQGALDGFADGVAHLNGNRKPARLLQHYAATPTAVAEPLPAREASRLPA